MKIYNVTHSINQSMSPVVETTYHLDQESALKDFKDFMYSVGDDYSTIFVEEFDSETRKTTLIESFEGNMDDLPEEYREEEDDDDVEDE